MNAGKTLTATSLVRGLKKAGYRVAALKATGTGSGNDMWIVRDAGADVVLDFTDAGYSGTYLIPQDEIEAATRRLIAHAALQGCDIAIVEVADGLQHLETAALIEAKHIWTDAVGVVFAAYDAMGAKCGVDLLRLSGHKVLAISGRIALSPLAMREAERATGLRVYTPAELQEGALVDVIAGRMGSADRRNGAAAPLERPASAGGAAGRAAGRHDLPARRPRLRPEAGTSAGGRRDIPGRAAPRAAGRPAAEGGAAGPARPNCPAGDGARRRCPLRRRPGRPGQGPDQPPQRLPPPALGDVARGHRAHGPAAPKGRLQSTVPRRARAAGGRARHGRRPLPRARAAGERARAPASRSWAWRCRPRRSLRA